MKRGLARWGRVIAIALGLLAAAGTAAVAQEGTPTTKNPDAWVGYSDIDPEHVQDRAATLSGQGHIQSELPTRELPEEQSISPFVAQLLQLLGVALKFIGWILLGVLFLGVAVLLFLMFTDLDFKNFRFGKQTRPQPNVRHGDIEEQPLWSRDALVRADELAKRGAFAEAVHVLLLGSFGELKARHSSHLPSSMTSREVIERIHMPDRARDALSLIIGAVEVSFFGDRDVSQTMFSKCREAFLSFAEPEGSHA